MLVEYTAPSMSRFLFVTRRQDIIDVAPPPPFSVLWMKQWHGPSSLRVGMFREQRLGTYVVQGKSLSEADREKNKQWLHKQTKKSVALCLQSERSRPTW